MARSRPDIPPPMLAVFRPALYVGHTAQVGTDQHLRFGPITEYHEWLSGPGDTLVVERLGPSD